ncbi:MAG: phosphoribosylglycinamide formyltransferase [Chitinophagia bacterium]|nr:phosphoribosylglycinamide formyltransferase [Chitinophagia bacterium]
MKSIIVFASGAGSNFSSIVQYAKTNHAFSIALLVTNKEDAPVIQLAKAQAIPVLILNKEEFNSTEWIATLTACQPSLIVLAGFLWKIPEHLLNAFNGKIINIHLESGITIHYVNEHYDEGAIILQEKIAIVSDDTPEEIAKKVQQLEHRFLPITIHKLLQ